MIKRRSMMKPLCVCAFLICVSTLALHAAHPLEGKWVGGIDTDRGQMQIGLEVKDDKGKLSGMVKTAHGDWTVKSVTDDKGTLTVTFTSGDGEGKMIGKIKDGRFTGTWDNSPMAKGTFDLAKSAAR
jgi:hypothetical protein